MKVLFYPLINHSLIEYPLQLCDYMNDCLFHGLRSILGDNLVDFYHMSHMYKTYNRKLELYGNGFTIFGSLDDIEIDRLDLLTKIQDKYFDQIIIPVHNNRFRSIQQNIEEIESIAKYGNVIKVVDGNDNSDVYHEYTKYGILFKRELDCKHHRVLPISFGVPRSYIVSDASIEQKTHMVSKILPAYGGRVAWTITEESKYRQEYQESVFAHTCKKGGWDCLRHYEIIGNGCIPIFKDINLCPEHTLTTLPKQTLSHINNIWQSPVNEDELQILLNELLLHARSFLTTEYIAERVLYNE